MLRWITADVHDGLRTLESGSVDLVVTSPPFLGLRSYLPDDHPDKAKEIGAEPDPAGYLDALLSVTTELRRVLAEHGSLVVELGDTYSGSGMGWTEDDRNPGFGQSNEHQSDHAKSGPGWPLAKSKVLIPELYRLALAYGRNPLTGAVSPAGQWRVRNVVTWARPNPPVGALGDKWRPATSDLVVACTSTRRYWDDLATRQPNTNPNPTRTISYKQATADETTVLHGGGEVGGVMFNNPAGTPLLDWWEIPTVGYTGSHYAVFPPVLVSPIVKAMTPPKVCRTCRLPARRILERTPRGPQENTAGRNGRMVDDEPSTIRDLGWSDCGHDDWRPGLVLDPFAGSGTTLVVASGHGHDTIGIDIDETNAELARARVGPFLFDLLAVD